MQSTRINQRRYPPKILIFLLLAALWSARLPAQVNTAPIPYGPLPSERQLDWHEMEFYGFLHFTVNTFTDKEWGYGDESPTIFNPAGFNADQIVLSLKASGMKGVILTAKHHDGFCLWPTKTTTHNIAGSPWKNGKGDVVKEVADACKRHGLKFGVYLSPWDRNSEHYGTPYYVTHIFQEQLRELTTRYGPIFESWFDGANGGDGYYGGKREKRFIDKATYYQIDSTWNIVRKNQPGSCIFSDFGWDVRWVGNEQGYAGDPSWPTYTPHGRTNPDKPGNGDTRYEEAVQGHRDGKYWMPAECDVSIRPGWFYHASENNRVRSVANLVSLYFKSVGRGASFLLNVPPTTDGLVHKTDSTTLAQFGRYLRDLYAVNYAQKAAVTASTLRSRDKVFAAANVADHDRYSYWATPDGVTTGELTLQFPAAVTFDVIRLRENIKLGVRSDDWEIDVLVNNKWESYAKGTAIGANRLIKGYKVTAKALRLRITKGAASICLSDIGVFNSPELPDANSPVIVRDSKGMVRMTRPNAQTGQPIVYARNSNAVSAGSTPYTAPFPMPESGSLSAAFLNSDGTTSVISSATFGLLPENWRLYKNQNTAKMLDTDNKALDGLPQTVWTPTISPDGTDGLIIDTQKLQTVKGFIYVPDASNKPGTIQKYACYVSENSQDWTLVQEGEFANIEANPIPQRKMFGKEGVKLRYIKLVPKQWIGGGPQVRIADWLLL